MAAAEVIRGLRNRCARPGLRAAREEELAAVGGLGGHSDTTAGCGNLLTAFGTTAPRMKPEVSPNEVSSPAHRPIRVLEHDPELGRDLDAEAFAIASRHLIARTTVLEPGEWTPPFAGGDDRSGQL